MSSIGGLNGIELLTQQLMSRFDSNKDGKLTVDEFSSVLRSMLEPRPAAVKASATTAATAATGSAAVSAATSAATPMAASGVRRTDHMVGFEPSKLAGRQSVKYQFARAAMQNDIESVKDKPSAEALLNSMKPAFEREGLKVLAVKGDRLQVDLEGQPIWVDVIRGSGSGTPAFQWVVEP